MRIDVTDNRLLSEIFAEAGFPLDMRCGGSGKCGRCKVRLVSGEWNENGRRIIVPAEALACRTRLISATGTAEADESSRRPEKGGVISSAWSGGRPLTVKSDCVVGIDIGTTTLAAVAVQNGKVIGSASRFNPQSKYGDNVISRISAAEKNLDGLRNVLLEALSEMLQELPKADMVAISGNSTMTCLFHGVDPSPIGRMPFALPKEAFSAISGTCLGLPEKVSVLTIPLISAYLGGDILAGVTEVDLQPGELFIDIGTNCEMVFRTSDGSYIGTAAAAGPAFEGAGISCGMRAVPGAICHYRSNDDYDMIPGAKPAGLCGSAMVDFLAAMRKSNRMSTFGRFIPQASMMDIADGIHISERDVEQLLKAKAAVIAGITTLEEHCGEKASRLVLAGGFAQYLDLSNAVQIGLLPERQCRIVGNTSLAGAARLATAPEYMEELTKLRGKIQEVPLNSIDSFEDNFIDGMMLP